MFCTWPVRRKPSQYSSSSPRENLQRERRVTMSQQLKRGGGGALVLQDAVACELAALAQFGHGLYCAMD